MKRDRLPYILIPFAALIAILPLILRGCSCGHDFDFHILSWLEAARQFHQGNFHPHWTFTPAFNAGEPRFVFYPPLSWTIGAILGSIFPWTWTPILYTWLALTAAGLSLHKLARAFTSPNAAILAAIIYLANPYTLFTAYERTAYAELLAAAIIPLLLLAILRPRVTTPAIAIPIALLWLTNAPAAVMSCYALALLTAIRLATTDRPPTTPGAPSSRRPFAAKVGIGRSTTAFTPPEHPQNRLNLAFTTITGTTLGLGLAAFYIVPAAYERRYVQIAMATLPGMAITDNFLFHHTGATPDDILHDQVLHTASVIALILITATILALIATKAQVPHPFRLWKGWGIGRKPGRTVLLSITILTMTITILLTPIATPIWHHAPELLFLQFPWRFLAIQAALMSLAIAVALKNIPLKSHVTAVLATAIAAALIYPAYQTFQQSCDPEDTVQSRTTLFQSPNPGTDPTDEYTPNTADNDSLAHNDPPEWLSTNPEAPAQSEPSAPANTPPGPAPKAFTINPPTPETLILNLRDYPAWHITLNGALVNQRLPRPDGLIAIPVPAGPSNIKITYATLPDQTLGAILSLISLILLGLMTLRSFIIKT